MGHYVDTEVVYTDSGYQDAYSEWAYQRSREEGIYASINTQSRRIIAKVYPASQALKYLTDYIDTYGMESGAPGFCVAVYREQDIARRTITLRATVDGETWGSGWDGRRKALKGLVASKVTLKDGEHVEDWQLGTRPEAATGLGGRECTRQVHDVSVHSKVVVTVPKEKTETRYFVHAASRSQLTLSSVKWDDGYPTQAKARAAMVERLEAATGGDNQALTVTALTRRESGAGLVTAERKITKAQVVVKVTVAKVKPGAKPGGWAMALKYHK